MKRIAAIACAVSLPIMAATLIMTFRAQRVDSVYEDTSRIVAEAAWLKTAVRPTGAVLTHPAGTNINPYFANSAMRGLLAASPADSPTVRKYLEWYFAHVDSPSCGTPGSISDYLVVAGAETPTYSCDSVDAYAATFITLLAAYLRQTGDSAFLLARKLESETVANAMLALQDTDGLTWGKATYKVKFLMDNCEVCQGLNDMAWLERALFADATAAARYQAAADSALLGLEARLWLDTAYAYAQFEDGSRAQADLDTWYPDATAQLWPVLCGVIPPDSARAQNLYAAFNAHQPGWPTLVKNDAFPWASIGYAARRMTDLTRVAQYDAALDSDFIATGRNWPYHVSEAGFRVLMLLPETGLVEPAWDTAAGVTLAAVPRLATADTATIPQENRDSFTVRCAASGETTGDTLEIALAWPESVRSAQVIVGCPDTATLGGGAATTSLADYALGASTVREITVRDSVGAEIGSSPATFQSIKLTFFYGAGLAARESELDVFYFRASDSTWRRVRDDNGMFDSAAADSFVHALAADTLSIRVRHFTAVGVFPVAAAAPEAGGGGCLVTRLGAPEWLSGRLRALRDLILATSVGRAFTVAYYAVAG